MRAILYPRVSSKKQAKEGDSIDAQTRRLKSYCKEKEFDIVGIYTDAGKSASISEDKIIVNIVGDDFIVKTSLNKRPGFKRILKEAKGKKFDAVVFFKWDRFSRDSSFSKHFKIYLKRMGVDLIPTDDKDDPFISDIRQAMGEEEIRKMKDRVRATRLERFERGMMVAKPPFGYKLNKRKKTMEIDKKKAEIVKKAFGFAVDGYNYKVTCNLLKLKPQQYYNIIRNIVYCGFIHFEGKTKKGVHEPLVSVSDWERVNK